jgi:hypothetical protein
VTPPSDPGSDPAGRRWTAWICPVHGIVMPGSPWATEHDDELIHTPTVPCNRICVETEVVPAGGLVAELEAERAKTRQLELDLLRQDSETCKLRDEALIQATKNAARAEQAEKAFAKYHDDEWDALEARAEQAENLLKRLSEWDHMQTASDGPYWLDEIAKALSGAERSAVPTVTVRETLEFYANEDNYRWGPGLEHKRGVIQAEDRGQRARAALAEHPRPGDGE